jgi:2-hydroxy-4-carboxymuconate semialdehyde hemiacetal dehydrogenase
MNICLIGYGMIAEHHVRALRTLEDVHLRWLVGRRAEPTREFAEQWGFEHQTLELDKALADDAVDAVVITSPNNLHAPQATAALNAGKHVLLEIPMAMTLADAQRLADLARQVDRTLMICHTMRFFPAFTHIRRLVDEGRFHMVQFVGQFFLHRRTNITALGKPRSWTDNLLWHNAAHQVDLAMWLCNCTQVQRVSYHVGPDFKQQGTMDMSLTMTLANGAIATVSQSYFAPGLKMEMLVIGHEETFHWKHGTLYDFEGKILVPEHSIMDLVDQDAEFVAAIRENRAPSIAPETIMPAMRVLEEAQAIADAEKSEAAG